MATINVSGGGNALALAIAGASPGDTLLVAAGVYDAVVIDKPLTIIGAGSGDDPATATIINPPGVGTGIGIMFAAGWAGASPEGIRVTDASAGIQLTGNAGVANLTFTDIALVGNALYGFNYAVGTIGAVTIADSVFSDNGSVGLRLASTGSHGP
jgi:hypothetical protein